MRLTVILWLLAAPALASWPGQLTSGTNHRFYVDGGATNYVKDAWAAHARTAAVERATLLGITGPQTNRFFRFERTNLQNIKDWVATTCVYFVDTTVATNDLLDGWFSANQSSNTPPFWTKDTLEAAVGAPTNYFDTTPWRALSSTNTALGWHYLDDALNQMRWIWTGSGLAWDTADATNSWGGGDTAGFGGGSFSWADAIASATGTVESPPPIYDFGTDGVPPAWYWQAYADTNNADHRAAWAAIWSPLRAVNAYTGTPALVDAYVKWGTYGDYGASGDVFNAYSLTRPQYLAAVASNDYFSGAATNWTSDLGLETNGWPTIIDEPDAADYAQDYWYYRWEGHYATATGLLYRFDATNGFDYVP